MSDPILALILGCFALPFVLALAYWLEDRPETTGKSRSKGRRRLRAEPPDAS